jgi:hypothetical protein
MRYNPTAMSDTDLSHIYANSNLDEAQDFHSELPHEMKLHMALGFASKSGKVPHPGKYAGPPANIPSDWQTAADSFGQQQMAQADAIDNIAAGGPPDTTGPTKLTDQKNPDFSSL